ncbi:flagellar hook protein FlgE [Paraburkholderia bonniea]|uniref:flagellar hook protein FlgE n=1 Tax=Paraburkholderia bonniea TaxID=2152891 RepID=UPI001291A17F|nr:flagellar hook protein FlgE [Paraburkholderia bonniea]WJF90429.1 flagellar hook protein FlgE [Paraburkholderia bonniea]WJF93744.1 flagellar hook protein FlgE [Paraburkholderia bonniea]
MGYEQGLSGLAGASNDLDVIGNNIANANTTGFKQGDAKFADVYANSVATAVDTQIGLGSRLASVVQQFTQGTISTTNQALDVAINGNGFFQMSGSNGVTYSRDGSFQLDKNGYIVNSSNLQLMGYAANAAGVISTAQTVPLQVPTANIPPIATTTITGGYNLNAQDPVPSKTPFSASDPTSYNYPSTVQVYDTLGGTQQVNMYFVKTATGAWDVYAGPATGTVAKIGSATFDTSGNLSSTTNAAGAPTANALTFDFSVPNTDGSVTPQNLQLKIAGTTQFGGKNGTNNQGQDGSASGQLTGFSVGKDGVLTGNYSNGRTTALGQVVLANFNNQNGLVNLGGNQYAETAASGVPQLSAPGTTNHGVLQGGALENSNVVLTNQLVDLITAQRNYQANAQTIKTQQAVDNTLINM